MHDLWDAQNKVSGNGLAVYVMAILISLAGMCILFMGFRLKLNGGAQYEIDSSGGLVKECEHAEYAGIKI